MFHHKMSCLAVLSLCLSGSLCAHGAPEGLPVVRRYYMAAGSGNVGNGTSDRPFGSFEEAKAAVRKAVADESLGPGIVEVVLENGMYSIASAVRFEREDSGSARHPVRWRSQSRLGARISGGISIPPFKKLTDRQILSRLPSGAHGKVLVSDLSELEKSVSFDSMGWYKGNVQSELVCGDSIQTLARWPNDGYSNIAKTPGIGHWYEKGRPKTAGFAYDDNRICRWKDEAEPRANGFFFHDWASNDISIERIDSSRRMILVNTNGWHMGMDYGFSREGIWYGYNLLCELDAPGEYFIDRKNRRVYFWPHKDDDTKSCRLTCSEGILRIGNDVSNITFAGLVFEDCRGDAVRAKSTDNVTFMACVFRNIGQLAFNSRATWRTKIIGCDIYNVGAGGLVLRGGDRETLQRADTIIENCHIHHYSTRALSYAAAVALEGCGFQLVRNTIHAGPHEAIKLDGPENAIVSNEIHSVGLDCGEMGAIYTYRIWLLAGSQVTANYIHDIYNPRYERNRGIMLDGGSAWLTISSNVFENVAVGISAGAIGHKIEGNAFINCKPPMEAWHASFIKKKFSTSILNSLHDAHVDSAPWKYRYPLLSRALRALESGEPRPAEIRSEICGNYTTEPVLAYYTRWGPYSKEVWNVWGNTSGMKKLADEKWVKAVKRDAGIYESKYRASKPVRLPVTIKSKRLVDENGPDQDGRFIPKK